VKSNISFVSVYLQRMCFFKKSLYFLTYVLILIFVFIHIDRASEENRS
jgi:hypothetical protein